METALPRFLLIVVSFALVTTLSLVALGSGFDPDEIVFPVDGEHEMLDNFGACRDDCSRFHEGVDILADKGVPVVAAAEGTVKWIGSTCCHLALDHGGGWETWYIHLNDDTQDPDGSYTDDDQGWGIAEEIEVGIAVHAGQLIGWVGDSGNAKGGPPHLHFEVRKDGVPIDPYPYLERAKASRQFEDVDHTMHAGDIDRLYDAHITRGCNPPLNDMYCPEDFVTRGQMAAFLVRTLGLTDDGGGDLFTDDDHSVFERDIDRLAAADITRGCNPPRNDMFCPEDLVTRGEMAAFLVRALGLTDDGGGDLFVDDDDSIFEDDIDRLAAAGITRGCNPPENDRFCPDDFVTRAQMASFLVRALGL